MKSINDIAHCSIINAICPYEYDCNVCRLYNDFEEAMEKARKMEESQKGVRMTEQEAIKVIKNLVFCGLCTTGPCADCERKQAKEVALVALEEIRQYRAIGTVEEIQERLEECANYEAIGSVEECREAVEKQKPKPPITYQGTNGSDCPICGAIVRGIKDPLLEIGAVNADKLWIGVNQMVNEFVATSQREER